MRIIGLDIGTVRIGVALSDPSETIASPLCTVAATQPAAAAREILALAAKHGATTGVYGLPLTLEGREEASARKVRAFVRLLDSAGGVDWTPWDERLTSVAANRALLEMDASRRERRQSTDRVAATLILQGWLDSRRPRSED